MDSRRGNHPIRASDFIGTDEGWWASVLADEYAGKDETRNLTNSEFPSFSSGEIEWDQIQSIYERDEIVILKVYGYNRGGLLVQGNRIQGFVPVSHLVEMPGVITEDDRFAHLASFVGKTLHLKIIECEPSQDRIVFSERAALAGEGKRKQIFQMLKPGQFVVGIVTNVTDFGIFIDLGGVEGLIHVSELSWGRVQHPKEILQIGQEVRALVLQVSEESARVALSLKRLIANPWETIINRYKPGDVIPAVVTDILKYGVFAKLEEGIEGLIHISSFHFDEGVKDLTSILQQGQLIYVRILHIDVDRRRLGLGLVATE